MAMSPGQNIVHVRLSRVRKTAGKKLNGKISRFMHVFPSHRVIDFIINESRRLGPHLMGSPLSSTNPTTFKLFLVRALVLK